MSIPIARTLGVATVALGVLSVVAHFGFVAATPSAPIELRPERTWIFWVSILCFAGLGALIVWSRPTNRIGWLLCAISAVHAIENVAAGYAAYALYEVGRDARLGALAGWVFIWTGALHYGPSGTYLLLLFPDGRLPSRRWRPVAAASAIGIVGLALGTALLPGPLPVLAAANNLAGVSGPLALALAAGSFALLMVCSVASAGSLGWRMRVASSIERLQIKWVAYGGGLVAVSGIAVILLGLPLVSATTLGSFAFTVLGLAAGVAILRHRLYDIDLLINRTLVYGAMTATLGAAYAIAVVLLEQLFRPLTQGSDLAIAASTLAVAAPFQPVRRRIQRAVDRRFYRRKYDAQRTLALFSGRLRAEIDLDTLGSELLAVVGETMQPQNATLWPRKEPP